MWPVGLAWIRCFLFFSDYKAFEGICLLCGMFLCVCAFGVWKGHFDVIFGSNVFVVCCTYWVCYKECDLVFCFCFVGCTFAIVYYYYYFFF